MSIDDHGGFFNCCGSNLSNTKSLGYVSLSEKQRLMINHPCKEDDETCNSGMTGAARKGFRECIVGQCRVYGVKKLLHLWYKLTSERNQ